MAMRPSSKLLELRRLGSFQQHGHVGPQRKRRIGAGQGDALDQRRPQQPRQRAQRQAELTLITLHDARVFGARLGQSQHRRVVLLGLVGHGQGGLETGEEDGMLVGRELIGQRIEFRLGVLDERLPVDFVDRDALAANRSSPGFRSPPRCGKVRSSCRFSLIARPPVNRS